MEELIIDDSELDALLLLRGVRKGGLDAEAQRVDTAETMEQAL